MRYFACGPSVSTCSCVSPLLTTPAVSHENEIVVTCAQCNGIVPEQHRTDEDTTTTPFPFSDLPLVAQRGVLECFEAVPPFPNIRTNKIWAVSAWDIDGAISVSRSSLCFAALLWALDAAIAGIHADIFLQRMEFRFGAQPDQSLIRDINIGTLENHPAAKEWKEYLDVAKTRKSLLSVSKHVRTEWAPRFWSTTTIHVGHPVPGSAHNVSPSLFEQTFLSKVEPRLLRFLRTVVYYPLTDRVNLVGARLAQGDAVGRSNTGHFKGMEELGEILMRHPDISNLANLSVFYRPLPQLIPDISEITLTADYYKQLRERWGLMDAAGSWRDFETAMSGGLLKGMVVKKEVGVEKAEEGNVRTLIWWKLTFARHI